MFGLFAFPFQFFTLSYFILYFIIFCLLKLHLFAILSSGYVVEWILDYTSRVATSLSVFKKVLQNPSPILFVLDLLYHSCIFVY